MKGVTELAKADKRRADGPGARTVTESTTMLLIAAGRLAQRRFEAALAEQNLTLRHIGAIGHLARNPELSYSDLARRARVTPHRACTRPSANWSTSARWSPRRAAAPPIRGSPSAVTSCWPSPPTLPPHVTRPSVSRRASSPSFAKNSKKVALQSFADESLS